MVIAISIAVIAVYKMIYSKLYLSVFDQKAAQILGINTKRVDFIFTILSATTISISAKTIRVH